jgi:hypothetical protein
MDEHDSPDATTPSFMNLFGVHLALRLVGKESLLKHLNAVPGNSFRLYWRTPLLHDASSEMMFLDATVTFDRSKISTMFGVLLKISSNHIYFIKTSPLTFSQLAIHAQNVGIDLDSTAPHAMARTMGSALIICLQEDVDKIQCVDGGEKITVSVPLHYTDLQETSPLVTESATVSKLDASTVDMLQSNFVQQDKLISKAKKESNETSDTAINTQVSSEVINAFEIWLNASASNVENQHDLRHSKVSVVSNAERKSCASLLRKPYTKVGTETSGGHTHIQGDNASNSPAKTEGAYTRSQPVAGYVRVTNTKRRRKLGFAAAAKSTPR